MTVQKISDTPVGVEVFGRIEVHIGDQHHFRVRRGLRLDHIGRERKIRRGQNSIQQSHRSEYHQTTTAQIRPAATAEPMRPAMLGAMACMSRKFCGSSF